MTTDTPHVADQSPSRLVLTTQGRYSAKAESALLPYRRQQNNYVVVATNNENRAKPDWFLNLKEEPIVQLQIGDAQFFAKAITPTGRARLMLLSLTTEILGSYRHKVPRDITTVVLAPMC
jgi:deazaflavin-dependent oxidoreductase (nitroreductase family)